MSGISMVLKNGSISKRDNKNYASMVRDTIHDFKAEINFEMMFNAYQEDTLMDGYLAKYDYFGSKWHADSGGLQVITAGRVITEELKEKVYKMQALHSDYAMCFDELPINVTAYAGSASRVDLSGRQFIVEWKEERATKTGLNVKKQIEIIRKMKSKTKVFLICQGNEIQDFVDFYDTAMAQIPKEYYSTLAGIAISAACTGLGKLETVKLLGSYKFMKIPKDVGNKLHLLGYGSINRLYPMLLLKASGYLNADITFDSSSHAMNTLLGEVLVEECKLFPNGGVIPFGKVRTPRSDRIFKYLYNKYSVVLKKYYDNISFDEYLKIVCDDLTSSKKFNLDCKKSVTIHLYTRFLIAYESFCNFAKSLIKIRNDIDNRKFDSGIPAINGLINVKTKEDYMKWFKQCSNHIPSNAIKRFKTLNEAQNQQAVLPI
jgi:hypothetical protein